MELNVMLLLLVALGLGLLLILGAGLLFLLKWGVIGHYVLKKEEPTQPGDYGLEQSQLATVGPVADDLNHTMGADNG